MNKIEEGRGHSDILANKVARNFHLSFRFSQGNTVLQGALMVAVARLYDPVKFTSEFPSPRDLKKKVKTLVNQARMPKVHGNIIYPQFLNRFDLTKRIGENKEFGTQWRRQVYYFQSLGLLEAANGDISRNDRNDEAFLSNPNLYEQMLRLSIERDMRWLRSDAGRPNRPERIDRFESFVREYVVLGRRTGSEEFNAIFADLRTSIQNMGRIKPIDDEVVESEQKMTKAMMGVLASLWEKRHPGESFFPQKPQVRRKQ